MKVANKVTVGDYLNYKVVIDNKKLYLESSENRRIVLNSSTVRNSELVDDETYTNILEMIAKGGGMALLAVFAEVAIPLVLFNGVSWAMHGIHKKYNVKVNFKNDMCSIIEIDEKLYKKITALEL